LRHRSHVNHKRTRKVLRKETAAITKTGGQRVIEKGDWKQDGRFIESARHRKENQAAGDDQVSRSSYYRKPREGRGASKNTSVQDKLRKGGQVDPLKQASQSSRWEQANAKRGIRRRREGGTIV